MAKGDHPSAGETAPLVLGPEIVNARLLNAPREKVYQAWIEPKHLANWWGPSGFTNTIHEFDPRPGGMWRFVMHGPDGTDYQNEIVFIELAPSTRIVFDHLLPMHKFRVTATFDDSNGKNLLTFRMRFETVAECDAVKAFVVDANEQNLDRLEAELAKMI